MVGIVRCVKGVAHTSILPSHGPIVGRQRVNGELGFAVATEGVFRKRVGHWLENDDLHAGLGCSALVCCFKAIVTCFIGVQRGFIGAGDVAVLI